MGASRNSTEGVASYLGQTGKPENAAALVDLLVSEDANFITGQNCIADGGRSLGSKTQKLNEDATS